MFWSDAVMDGPLLAAINDPIAASLLRYRQLRLHAAVAIAKLNNYSGAYWSVVALRTWTPAYARACAYAFDSHVIYTYTHTGPGNLQ